MGRQGETRGSSASGQGQTGSEATDLSYEAVRDEFTSFISSPNYPCVGAKAASNMNSCEVRLYEELASPESTARLARELEAFLGSDLFREHEYASFIAIFRGPAGIGEREFEKRLWRQLTQLNQIDAQRFGWDQDVKSDPADPEFSFSFAGRAVYVIGLHAQSSRVARQFRWPALVFNAHEQFERLRAEGKWKRMQGTIRERDALLQGFINPMLSDFGERSEARQYSGRAVEPDWKPEFVPEQNKTAPAAPGRCPFHH